MTSIAYIVFVDRRMTNRPVGWTSHARHYFTICKRPSKGKVPAWHSLRLDADPRDTGDLARDPGRAARATAPSGNPDGCSSGGRRAAERARPALDETAWLDDRARKGIGSAGFGTAKNLGTQEQSQGKATRTSTSVTEPGRQPALPWRCGRPWQGCGAAAIGSVNASAVLAAPRKDLA